MTGPSSSSYDAETGEQIAKKALGTSMRSTPLVADGKLYTCTNGGGWYILKPTEDGVEVVHKLRLDGDESDGSPIVSHGRIYLPTSEALYCIGDPNVKPTRRSAPDGPKESPSQRIKNRPRCKSSRTTSLSSPAKRRRTTCGCSMPVARNC